jgi:hypothetical protein
MALQVFYKKKLPSSDVAIAANISFFFLSIAAIISTSDGFLRRKYNSSFLFPLA